MPVDGTPGGGPSDCLILDCISSSRSLLTSVNLTTRTNTASPFARGRSYEPTSLQALTPSDGRALGVLPKTGGCCRPGTRVRVLDREVDRERLVHLRARGGELLAD